MSLNPTTQLVIKVVLWVALWALIAFLSAPLMAEEITDSRISRSISFSKSAELDKDAKDSQFKEADADVMAPLNKQGYRQESVVMASHITTGESYRGEVWVYDAFTELISDINYDGFYHRFSVVIDADTVFDTAYIYARLYLSYEGGPWNHYATSDNYIIHGDSELDSFIIETELADGFPPGYYDIRIELYDADYGDWLLSYGPYDDASLSVLPLEDSYYDDQYSTSIYPVETEIVVAGHGGSISWLLMVPALLGVVRRLRRSEYL